MFKQIISLFEMDLTSLYETHFAQLVLEKSVDGVGPLSSEECSELGIDRNHCDVWAGVMKQDSKGIFTPKKRQSLAALGYSNTLIEKIASRYGQFRQKRIEWLADNFDDGKWLLGLAGYSLADRATMTRELAANGPDAAPAIPDLISLLGISKMHDYPHSPTRHVAYELEDAAIEALLNIGEPARKAVAKAANNKWKLRSKRDAAREVLARMP